MTKEEIIDGLEIYTVGKPNKATVHITVEELQKFIDALKALEQQQKTGHWIKKDGYGDCSECGSHIVTEWDYCPKCGARMVEP